MTVATQPIPIYTGTDFFVPHFEVMVGNRRQSGAVCRDVIQVKYQDHCDQIDSFELTVNNWEAGSRKFKYHDQPLFDPGQMVALQMGYLGASGGGLRTMIRGEITGLRVSFPSGGQPTLVVTGQNILHRFRNEQRSERYDRLTYSEIAQRICARNQVPFVALKALIPETRHPSLTQTNDYDLKFLMSIADKAGYELVVTEDQGQTAITFGPPNPAAKATYQLTYGRSLIEFQPEISFAQQVEEVVVRGFDRDKGQNIEVKAGGGTLAKKIKPGAANPAKGRKEIVGHRAVRDEQAARELAQATLARIHNEAVKATGSVIGLPDLRTGCQLHIDGLGKRFNGRYFVTATTHTLGTSGYVTQFECRLEELSNATKGESLLAPEKFA